MAITRLLVVLALLLLENAESQPPPFSAIKIRCAKDPDGELCERFLQSPSQRQAAFKDVCVVGSMTNFDLCEDLLKLVVNQGSLRHDIQDCFVIDYDPSCHNLMNHDATKELFSLFQKTAEAFKIFSSNSPQDVAISSKYRVSSNCTDEMISKCSEFDTSMYAEKNHPVFVTVLNEVCSRKYTNLQDCKFFMENLVRSAPEALHRSANYFCSNNVVNSPSRLRICYNLLDVPCDGSHLSLSCNKFKYIRTFGEFNYVHDYNKTDLQTTAKKALYMFILRQNEKIMGTLLEEEQHGLVNLLTAACENSFVFKGDTCDYMWMKVLPTQSHSAIVDVMVTFCWEKSEDDKEENVKPTCKKILANLCRYKNETCDLEYVMELMHGSVLNMNSSAIHITFDRHCGKGTPNVSVLLCQFINVIFPRLKEPLKKLVESSCGRQEDGEQCKHLLKMTFSMDNNTLKAYCFDRFVNIALENNKNTDFYCKTIFKGSPGANNRTDEFNAFQRYINVFRSIISLRVKHDFKNWIRRLNRNADGLSSIEIHYAEATYLSFSKGRREALLQHCDYKLSRDCEKWISRLNELGSLASEYKSLCPDRNYQKELMCENMILACEKVEGSCQPLIDYFIKRSYTPMSCRKNNMICRYAFNESCLKKLDEYRCYPLLERMGSAKIIDLMPECELAHQTTSCRMIWERINKSSSVDLLEEIIQGYCEIVEGPNWELKPTLGRACKAIKRMCLWEPILGCFHLQSRWYPIYLHLSPIIFTVSIFGMAKAVVTVWLAYLDECQQKREREHQRRDFAAVTFQKYLLPGEVEQDTRLTPHERVRRHKERQMTPEDRQRAAETEKRCKAIMEEVKRRVAERRQQERFDQEDAEMEAQYAN